MKAYKAHELFVPPIVLDCEASGLHPTLSYPIEVGYILPDGTQQSYLIRPEESWTHWEPEAEKVHNIPREQLFDEGLHAFEVARKLNSQLAGETVYSDADDYERMWLGRLFEATHEEMLFGVGNLFTQFIQHQHTYFWKTKKALRKEVVAHRASADAWVLQEACIRSRADVVRLHHSGE